MENDVRKLVAVLSDLMFTVKIQEAAKRSGFEPVFVKTQADALAQAQSGAALVILDLNDRGFDALATITALKNDPKTCSVPLLSYVSHVQADLRRAAEEAGCDTVVARSVFVQRLPELLETSTAF